MFAVLDDIFAVLDDTSAMRDDILRDSSLRSE